MVSIEKNFYFYTNNFWNIFYNHFKEERENVLIHRSVLVCTDYIL